MNIKPKVALAQDFLANLSKLPNQIQGKVLKWALEFQSNPTAPGINYETIKAAREKSLRSIRIDRDWRGIVFKPDKGDVYVLMYVDRHDEAYRWAESRRLAINPVTGALQVFATENVVEPALAEARRLTGDAPRSESGSTVKPPAPALLYAHLSDEELLSIGTPVELVPQVRSLQSDVELDAIQPFLPVEAYEGLFLIAAGDSVQEVLGSREMRQRPSVDTSDFATAIETAESQARFFVVDDEGEMAAVLNSPLSLWRIFLHPTQRKLAQGNRSGPMRVLGGAGTGKTVLAMHRAKWLAEHATGEGKKVLLTTFTRNLAHDIESNLKALCSAAHSSAATLQKIEVRNLDAWVHAFLRRHKYEYKIVFRRDSDDGAKAAWERALTLADSSLGLPPHFYEEEFERVVSAQGVTSRDEYRQARRTGRGTLLNRTKRDAIWPVFEEYRTGLTSRKLKEVDDAYRDAAALLKEKPSDFTSIIVDETQDFGIQALRLLRAMVEPGVNDLFFVGDGHQRIYQRNRASMTACGIDIRGRSRKLYLNYRTTEEIRRAAVALLEGCEVDDLDEGSDEVKRYKSLTRGPKPAVLDVPNRDEAFKRIASLVNESIAEERTVCVMVPTKREVDAVAEMLKRSKVPATIIGPNETDHPDLKSVRIATMHRAKGLEFDEVVLMLTPGSAPLFSGLSDQRCLTYVALTRAKKMATTLRIRPSP
jgi:hypothetical protein